MTKLEIKNKIVELFNSIDLSNLNEAEKSWYEVMFTHGLNGWANDPKVTVTHLNDLHRTVRNFVKNLNYYQK